MKSKIRLLKIRSVVTKYWQLGLKTCTYLLQYGFNVDWVDIECQLDVYEDEYNKNLKHIKRNSMCIMYILYT